MMDLHDLPDRIVLALCIWGEARGEAVEGQIAVANVVRNRLRRHPGQRWRDICLAPLQFSCFNATDPNSGPIARASVMLQTQTPTPELLQALWVADGMIAGLVMDNTRTSTHYLTRALFETAPPTWAVNVPIRTTIGAHVFLDVA